MVKSPPMVALPDVVRLVAVVAGKLAAMFDSVTPRLEPLKAIAKTDALLGVVVVVKSLNFCVAIYCIVHVVVTVTGTSCQSSGAIALEPSC